MPQITLDVGWKPVKTFEEGLAETVTGCIHNRAWAFSNAVTKAERLGHAGADLENATVYDPDQSGR